MATIHSLTESLGVLKRNPTVFAVGLLYAVIILPQTALSLMGVPIVPRLVQAVTFFITPFVFAGLVLVFLLVMFFLQFYAPAIVADNVGAIEGYRRSVGLVKQNFLETLGFGVLNLVISALLLLPAVGLVVLTVLGAGALGGAGAGAAGAGASEFSSTAGSTAETGLSLAMMGGFLAYSFLTTTVMTPFRAAFSVSFYDNHRPSNWD